MGAQHGKAPVSPATGRSCGLGTAAAQRWGGAHCCGTTTETGTITWQPISNKTDWGGKKHIYFCFVANDPMSHKQLMTKYDHDLLRGFNLHPVKI